MVSPPAFGYFGGGLGGPSREVLAERGERRQVLALAALWYAER